MRRVLLLLLSTALATGLLVGVGATEALAPKAEAADYVTVRYSNPKKGQSNKGVVALQRRLVAADALNQKYVTGHFGTKTENGVKRFQRAARLKVDGKVSRTTWSALVKETGRVKITKPFHWPNEVRLPKQCKTSGRVLCVDKSKRNLYYVNKGRIIKTVDARFGCAGMATREGTFAIRSKSKHHVSGVFHTPMPYAMFFSGGQAVHYSPDFARSGYAGCSHGCVNIRDRHTIAWIFSQMRVGDRVYVYRS